MIANDPYGYGSTEHKDPAKPPPPIMCQGRCDQLLAWQWREFRFHPGGVWKAPVEVCSSCEARAEAEKAEAAYRARQEGAGIPMKYRAYSFDSTVTMMRGVDSSVFRRQCLADKVFGVTPGNMSAMMKLRAWQPGQGSFWLHGRVGGGKTLLACMVASKMVRPDNRRTKVAGGIVDTYTIKRADRSRGVLYTNDALMIESVNKAIGDSMARRETEDPPDPLRRLMEVEVLIYDDIGTDDSPRCAGKRDQLVNHRYENDLPTIFTSNVPLGGVGKMFSTRTVDRFAEMFGNGEREIVLRDSSWRTS